MQQNTMEEKIQDHLSLKQVNLVAVINYEKQLTPINAKFYPCDDI